jgi:cytochrome c556
MNRAFGLSLATALVLAYTACSQEPAPVAGGTAEPAAAPSNETAAVTTGGSATALVGSGWTGLTQPGEVIEARRLLMQELERQIAPLDLFTLGRAADLDTLRSAAATMEPMLIAFPHLFPPTTNLFQSAQLESPTIALPAIWEDFDAFQQIAIDTEEVAVEITKAETAGQLRTAARRLRARCDACHARFTRPYTPPEFQPQDYEFDFESALPED